MNKKDLLIKAYQLKNKGYSKNKTKSILLKYFTGDILREGKDEFYINHEPQDYYLREIMSDLHLNDGLTEGLLNIAKGVLLTNNKFESHINRIIDKDTNNIINSIIEFDEHKKTYKIEIALYVYSGLPSNLEDTSMDLKITPQILQQLSLPKNTIRVTIFIVSNFTYYDGSSIGEHTDYDNEVFQITNRDYVDRIQYSSSNDEDEYSDEEDEDNGY